MEWLDFDMQRAMSDLLRVLIAYALALPLGWERNRASLHIGLRTFPLVAIASCGYVLVIRALPASTIDSQARVLQGLLAGIGFIGGGAILRRGMSVRGLATAASIWNTGAIGAAVAYGRMEIGVVLSLINFLTLYFLTPIARDGLESGQDSSVEADSGAE
jgi:putative Mg2+ transporter-C (MgtC) family protein